MVSRPIGRVLLIALLQYQLSQSLSAGVTSVHADNDFKYYYDTLRNILLTTFV